MENQTKPKKGKLYIVSTHIGNKEDVTIRAMEVLKFCDLVICEELKVGAKILKELMINNKLDTMNEQNEDEKIFEFIDLLKNGKKLALISDCGTPVFADPGLELIRNAIISEIEVIVVPGASSLMTAIVRSGMPLDQFLYAGFLSRNSEERVQQLKELSVEKRTVVLYDTPYRLLPVLEGICKIMPQRRAYIGMNLTMPFETHHYGTFQELYDKFKNERIKAEFVIVFEGIKTNFPQFYYEGDTGRSAESKRNKKNSFVKKQNFSSNYKRSSGSNSFNRRGDQRNTRSRRDKS